jgi:mercuric reductase
MSQKLIHSNSDHETVDIHISGMTCAHCATEIERQLSHPGILSKSVSYPAGKATVMYDPAQITLPKIESLITEGGTYRVTGYETATTREKPKDEKVNGDNTKHLIIIGGGSAAFSAALQARELGAKATIINDRLPIGGTCVNVGCVPSKNLIRAAEAVHRARHIPFDGIAGNAVVENFKALIAQKAQLVASLRQRKYIDVVTDLPEVRIIQGRATLRSAKNVEVNGEIISGSHILIATGVAPKIPDIPGLADSGYLTNESAFELEELPESLIVLGGRYVALETAQMFARLGSKVTILQRSNRILPDQQSDITDALTGYLRDEGIEVHTGVTVREVRRENGHVIVNAGIQGKTVRFTATHLLAATGRKPNTSNMGLENVGVLLDEKGFLKVDETLQTNIPGIYGAGDVIGGPQFVYTAAYEGKLAAANALSGTATSRDYTPLPWVIFTDPQVAGVGMDEIEARNNGIDADAAVLPLSHVPRALAARDTRGFIKLIRNRDNDRIIGARILAPEGSELLMEVAVAIKYGLTVGNIVEMFHPYLTLGEGIKLAAITFNKSVEQLSCCAS